MSDTRSPGRVLILLASDQLRGAEIEGASLARELRTSGWATEVLGLVRSEGATRLDIETLAVNPRDPRALWVLRRRAAEYDAVVAYGSTTLPACAIGLIGTGVPFVYRSIGDPGAWVRSSLHRRRTGWLFRRADAVVALWDGAAESVQRLYGVDPKNIFIVPNARSGERFAPASADQRAAARLRFGLSMDTKVVVAVGSLSAEKSLDVAIRAVASIEDAALLVAGTGPLRGDLEGLALAVAPERVRFLGSLDDVRPLLHAADVLVLSSKTEGMPGAIIEAGLCGVPAAATDVGAVSTLVDHGRTGIMVAVDDVPAMEDGLRQCISSSGSMGHAARDLMLERFDWAMVRAQWSDALKTVLGRPDTQAKPIQGQLPSPTK